MDDEPVFFHGTTKSRAEKIKKEGLLANPPERNYEDSYFVGERGKSVYLIPRNPLVAHSWATRLGSIDAELAAVFKVHIPVEKRDSVKPDEMVLGAVRFVGDIPPEWLEQVY